MSIYKPPLAGNNATEALNKYLPQFPKEPQMSRAFCCTAISIALGFLLFTCFLEPTLLILFGAAAAALVVAYVSGVKKETVVVLAVSAWLVFVAHAYTQTLASSS